MIGRITADPFVETVKNGEAKALFAQVEFSHDDEVRTVQVFPGIGEDSWPCKGDIVAVEKAGGFYYISGIWDGAEPKLKPGEREFYSRNARGEKAASLSMLNNGDAILETNGNKKEEIGGNENKKVAGQAKYESADMDIKSTAPVGINNGLYSAALAPYLSAETAAVTALQSAVSAASAQLASLDAMSGAAGTVTALGAAIAAFCAAIQSADTAAHTGLAQIVK